MQKLKIAALSTLFLISLSAGSCQPKVRNIPIPPDRLVCEGLPAEPKLTALDWSKVQTVEDAKTLVFIREGETADYIVKLRGAWFSCHSDVEWNRTRQDELGE